jgi:FMN-dependent oxidoreductase (nitrilotriacetate monooxygenase family)
MANQKRHVNLLVHINLLAYETKESRQPLERRGQSGTFEHIVRRALLVEEAGFDGVFYGDGPSLNRETLTGRGPFGFEPFTLLSALSARTSRLGLIGTVATSYNDPYNLARRFASLDRISDGRAAWNSVTGFTGDKNFGPKGLLSPAERYERAHEFIEVVLKLWTSWGPGYLRADPASGSRLDPDKIRDIEHHGTFYDVEEALNVPPSPQGYPVIVHAGASEPGVDLGGRYGELIYVAAPTFDHALEFTSAYRAKGKVYGRDQDGIKIAPGLFAYIGATREEAEVSRQRIFGDEQLLGGLGNLKTEYAGFDFSGYELDDVLRQEDLPTKEDILASGHRRSRALLYLEFANKPGATLRSFLTDVVSGTGHATLVGSYDEVADELERWHRAGVADGFVLMGTSSLEQFIGEVVPRLERKGIYRRRPELTTFRDRLGLPTPGVAAESAPVPVSAEAVS